MIRTGKGLASIGLGLFLVFGGVGCMRSESNVIRIANFMTDPILIQILTDQVALVQKDNPDLTVRVESIPYPQYQEKIITQAAAGDAPDVIFVEVNNFVNLYTRGIFEDLNPYLLKDELDLSGYYPGPVGRFTREGHLYALPQDTAPTGLIYYNKEAFKEAGLPEPSAGWSWPEPFLSICRKLVKRDSAGRVTRFAYSEAYPIQLGNFIYSNGADWVDDPANPKRCVIDSPAFLQAARFRWDLIHAFHVAADPTQLQSFNPGAGVQQLFAQGKVALMASGIWETPQLLKNGSVPFDVVPFPQGPGGKRGWGTGGSGYAISRTSKHKEAAWKIIRALLSDESLKRMAATGFIQPAKIDLAESDDFLKAPGASRKACLLKMPLDAHYEPFDPHWNEIYYGVIQPALDPVWLGKEKPEQVLRDLAVRINEKFYPSKARP